MRSTKGALHFPPFSLDLDAGVLRRGKKVIKLRPKTWTLLCVLVERADRLVTKDELLEAVWPDTAVGESSITNCISELRTALSDSRSKPRFIKAVHGRGYRWIAEIESSADETAELLPVPVLSRVTEYPTTFVGRRYEVDWIRKRFDRVVARQSQFVFVTGSAGIGKSTLIDFTLSQVAEKAPSTAIGRGHCIEQHGASEPYLPILEALTDLGRGPHRQRLVEVLHRYAPTWLAQLPSLVSSEVPRQTTPLPATTSEKMLREMGDAIEVFADEIPLVLALEDLHWSDASSLALIGYLARRCVASPMLLIGSLRPIELHAGAPSLRAVHLDLLNRPQCEELALGFLTDVDIDDYLQSRFSPFATSAELASVLHQLTEGNPVFLTAAVDSLVAGGSIANVEGNWRLTISGEEATKLIPGTLKQMIGHQIESLNPEILELLQIASVGGGEFTTQAVAAAAKVEQESIERTFGELARRRHMLRDAEGIEWPDGSPGTRFHFVHALYANALYEQITPTRRRRLHQRIGERIEAAWKGRTATVCSELAMHFERAGDHPRAVQYLREAAVRATKRGAPTEAVRLLERALASSSPAGDSRSTAGRIRLMIDLAIARQSASGYIAPGVEELLRQAKDLAIQQQLPHPRFLAASALYTWLYFRGAREHVEVAAEMLEIDQQLQTPFTSSVARCLAGGSQFALGNFEAACELLEQSLAFDPPSGTFERPNYRVSALMLLGRAWTVRGLPARGADCAQTGMTHAAEMGPIDHLFALCLAATRSALVRDLTGTILITDEALSLVDRFGLTRFAPWVLFERGWARTLLEDTDAGLEDLFLAMDRSRAAGVDGERAWHQCLLGSALLHRKKFDEARNALESGLQAVSHQHDLWPHAELCRLQGEWSLAVGKTPDEAWEWLQRSVEIARQQKALWWELRATTSLAKLSMSGARARQARLALEEVRAQLVEGHDFPDWKESADLLRERG